MLDRRHELDLSTEILSRNDLNDDGLEDEDDDEDDGMFRLDDLSLLRNKLLKFLPLLELELAPSSLLLELGPIRRKPLKTKKMQCSAIMKPQQI